MAAAAGGIRLDAALVERAAQLLADATGLLVLAGAGIGVDSGLPDFRGDEGFWRAYPVLRGSAMRLADIANPQAFIDDPALAWGFYGHRLAMYRDTEPHGGFAILRRWCDAMADGGRVSTTNVDGQFQKAGFAVGHVYELHGSIHYLQCLRPCGADIWTASRLRPEVGDDLRWTGAWPRCPRCNATARPNILMFGDGEWIGVRYEAQYREILDWLDSVRRLALVEIGAGTAIPSLRIFGDRLVRYRDAKRIRINLREPGVTDGNTVAIAAGALRALTAIDRERPVP